MKKIIPFVFLLAISATTYSQQSNPSQTLTKQDYLAKSKSQKTAAFILLGIGVTTLLVASFADVDFDALGTLVVVGGIATLTSIPLFIASGKNKRRAKNITGDIKMEFASSIQKQSLVKNYFPAFSMKLTL